MKRLVLIATLMSTGLMYGAEQQRQDLEQRLAAAERALANRNA